MNDESTNPRPISRGGREQSWSQRRMALLGFTRWGYDERGWRQTTRDRYASTVMSSDTWLIDNRHTSIYDATPDDLRAWISTRTTNPGARNSYRSAVVAFFDWVNACGLRSDNPAKELPRLPRRPHLPRALEASQVLRILDIAKVRGPMWEALVLLLAYGALRATECRTLKWDQWHGDWIRIDGKGGRERDVPVHPKAKAALQAWEASSGDLEWMWPSPVRPGRPISYSHLNVQIKDMGEAAGIGNVTCHMLRHSLATRMVETGVDVRTVQEMLGHVNLATTSIYLKARPARVRDALNATSYEEDAS